MHCGWKSVFNEQPRETPCLISIAQDNAKNSGSQHAEVLIEDIGNRVMIVE